MENTDSQQSAHEVEMLDVADVPANRPRPTRGRPPGSGNRNRRSSADLSELETPELVGVGVAGSAPVMGSRINGRPTRVGRGEKPTPSRVNSDKPIFTLSVAAEILALHPRTLRIYEEHGLVVPHRTQTQRRRYSQNDIKKFQFIQFLTQRRRVNLEGVKIILAMLDELARLGVSEPIKHVFADYQETE